MKALIKFKNKARTATIASGATALAFAVFYAMSYQSATEQYASDMADYSYLAASRGMDYYMAVPNFMLFVVVVAAAVASVAIIAWVAANLLIAYKTDDDPETSDEDK